MMDAELLARATEFSFLPESASIGDREVFYFTVTVARRFDDLWAVLWMDQCWNKKAQSREHEPQGHSRTTSVQRGSSRSCGLALQKFPVILDLATGDAFPVRRYASAV